MTTSTTFPPRKRTANLKVWQQYILSRSCPTLARTVGYATVRPNSGVMTYEKLTMDPSITEGVVDLMVNHLLDDLQHEQVLTLREKTDVVRATVWSANSAWD